MSAGMDYLILVGVGFISVALFVYALAVYNGLVSLRNNIKKSWSNIDVLLIQRADEIPNLVETVKGYMQHERTVYEAVAKARSDMLNARDIKEKAGADKETHESLKTLFAIAENYPELKASDNFLALQKRLTGIENEIADRRELYNDCVTLYNTRIHSIPDMFVADLLSYGDANLFRADKAKKAPVKVDL